MRLDVKCLDRVSCSLFSSKLFEKQKHSKLMEDTKEYLHEKIAPLYA